MAGGRLEQRRQLAGILAAQRPSGKMVGDGEEGRWRHGQYSSCTWDFLEAHAGSVTVGIWPVASDQKWGERRWGFNSARL